MTKEDIARVQATWHTIEPVKRIAAELFYVKLFELDPRLKLHFGDDLQLREAKFLQILDATVEALTRADVMTAAVRELGIRNPLFGNSDEHHRTVATALFWTLEKCLRKDFTQEVRAAWTKTCETLSQMIRSATLTAASQAA
jgi:hemoglobin-like flavoprotein